MSKDPGIANAPATQDKFFEALVSSAPGIFIVIDAETGGILYQSKDIAAIAGVHEAGTNGGMSFFDILEGDQKERFLFHLQDVASNKAAQTKYGIYRLGNAGWHIYAVETAMPGEPNRQFYQLHLMPEMSRHKIPFLSFDSRELFFEQFKTLGFGTFEWIIGSDIVFWSEGVYDIYEIEKSNESLNYEYVNKFTHPEDSKKARAAVQRALEQGGDFSIETRIITPGQKVKVIESAGRVIQSPAGVPVKLVGSIMDVTAERKMAQELERNVGELSRSNKELEEFAYVASHDLQEPLRKITTFCGRLAEKYNDVLTGDGALYMDRIVASAENMRMLINNLLEFSRVSRNTEPFEPVNLNFVLHQVKNDLELVMEETGTEIESNNLPSVHGSMTQMKQLFGNIISNAIKFRKTGERPKIKIEAGQLADNEKLELSLPQSAGYEKITICDNGIGFNNEYSDRIFQIFQRLNGKSEYPGSGIGLAICKKIIERHNGLIFAEGEEGKGACFTLVMPAGKA